VFNKLTQHGNSLAVVPGRPILDLLNADTDASRSAGT
jgi:hypothetical protein